MLLLLVVLPSYSEADNTLRLDKTLKHRGELRPLLDHGLEGLEDLFDSLCRPG